MEEKLQDKGAVLDKVSLKCIDIVVTCFPEFIAPLPWRKLLFVKNLRVHFDHENIFIIGAVEETDLAACRKGTGIPPEEIVIRLFFSWYFKTGDPASLGIDPGHYVLDG